jgi:primosomal protein N' (replication factor Y)
MMDSQPASCERRQAGLPPYAYQVLVTAEHAQLERALAFLQAARACADASPLAPKCNCMTRCRCRWCAVQQGARPDARRSRLRPLLQRFVSEWVRTFDDAATRQRVRWQLEIDPLRI